MENEEQKKPNGTSENFLKELIKFTIIVLVIVIPIRMYIAQPFIVSGSSMDPTFATGQYLIVDEISYRFENPKRGDVIILKYPKNPSQFFIKRIVGLPGETVIIKKGKVSIVNSQNPVAFDLDEKYVDKDRASDDDYRMTLSSSEYFVMGDNRAQSSDSRSWGALPSDNIVGRPFLRLLPFSLLSVYPGLDNVKVTK